MNAKHLRELLEQGHRVQIISNETKFTKPIKHRIIDWSENWYFIGENQDGSLMRYTDANIEQNFTNDYKIVTPAPKLLEVGDEVEIVDSYQFQKPRSRNISTFVIEDVDNSHYTVSYKNKSLGYGNLAYPHRAVAKLAPKEDETIKIIDGKKYKLLDTEE